MKRKMSEIGFDPADIWKDTTWFQPPFYDKIVSELEDMLVKTQGTAQGTINPYQVNFIQVQGHGVMYQKDSLIIVPTACDDGSLQPKYLNINNWA